jgi:DNA modification methylase
MNNSLIELGQPPYSQCTVSRSTFYLGDCLVEMSKIADKSIDMILCDLPYGVTAPKWDEHIDIKSLWKHYNRIIKNDGTIALFSAQPFTTKLIASNESDFRYCWYWIKNQATNFFHAKRMPVRKVEEICIFKKGKYYPQITDGHIPTNSAKGCSNGKAYHGTNKRNYEGGKTTRYPNNVLDFKCVDNYSRIHSSEKPVELLEYLIKTYTDEGDTVLDNCFGSGSTAIACEKSNRIFVGMENDNDYFTAAISRVSAYCG